ncbi:DUF6196 family protein [Novosphingobium sp.]|uniref:DUF6196 family protein n=1 Tax=Novosphingobium sp. TaxID=1874826 RepID=UPI003BAD88BB
MVSVSNESVVQTDSRLRRVIQEARLKLYDGIWTFESFPISEFAARANHNSLAFVRDDEVWSQLVEWTGVGERFALFRFHFQADADNSGFVGWLASLLKAELGTGVFVTCGSNDRDGGIFDYWGCPYDLRDAAFAVINRLVAAL